ncbi:UDP-N-acetylmuramoylalanine--D-glutamate ligase [candidate division SR1 bacterium]|nr:UDP-N-acetylmuramoylalanine--D-glutamate ligase [candidate division SR1 bacterium]
MNLSKYQSSKIAILGFGREGKSTLNFLLKHGISPIQITILDQKEIEKSDLPEGMVCISGQDYLSDLDSYDIIFKTAGMSYNSTLLVVKDKLMTQVQFFFDNFRGKVIAITASKGKTTMTSMAYSLLQNAGFPVILAGNIGKPVLDQISNFDDPDQYVVIELSSFMLETLVKKNFISILGSIFPVHLDWHGNMENYLRAKARILLGSETNIMLSSSYEHFFSPQPALPENLVLTGKNTPYTRDKSAFYSSSKKLFDLSEIQLLGEHNLRNISAIVALASKMGISDEILVDTIRNFAPVRHRLQKVGTFRGIDFYDDAISTSPFSSIAALDALGDQVDTLFLGGVDGRYDFSALVDRIKKSQIRNLVLFPDSGQTIATLLASDLDKYNVIHTRSMEEGVRFAYDHTSPGKIALLSTATPSFSLRKDFEEKGDLFQEWVIKLGG